MNRLLTAIVFCIYNVKSYSYTSMSCTADTSYRNSHDGEHNAVKSNYFLSGHYSEHNNHHEDRQFKWDYCKPSSDSYPVKSTTQFTATAYDSYFVKDCNSFGTNYALYKAYSTHDDKHEDRTWTFTCGELDEDKFRLASCSVTGYVNAYDNPVDYKCPSNGVLRGLYSKHSNNNEDRQWGFYCCRVVDAVTYTDMECIEDSDYVDSWEGEETADERPGYFISGQEISYTESGSRKLRWKYCEPTDVQQEMVIEDLTVTADASDGSWTGSCSDRDDTVMVGEPVAPGAGGGVPLHHTFECGLLDTSMYRLNECQVIEVAASTDGSATYMCPDEGVIVSMSAIPNDGGSSDWEFECCRIADADSLIFSSINVVDPYPYPLQYVFSQNVVYGVGALFCLFMVVNVVLLVKSWCCKSKRNRYKVVSMQSTDDETVCIANYNDKQ